MSNVKLNIQQVPKSRGYLECLRARPKQKLIQLDFNAIEPTIVAQFSKCPNYRKLYGPEANPNQDVYLFVGARFRPFRDKFLQHYDPENPTREGTALAKKLYKTERAVSKEAHLAMQYGAGANTVHSALIRKEIDIDIEEVFEMHQAYWSDELFAVVKEFEVKLKREWRRNNGWITNAVGIPRALAEDKLKDLLSRYAQSSGHDLLQRLMRLINEERKTKKVPFYPWIVDLHDESIWETEDQYVDEVLDIFRRSMTKLNEQLGWEIQVRGEPTVARTLADIKIEG
jgi:hypothetical protein